MSRDTQGRWWEASALVGRMTRGRRRQKLSPAVERQAGARAILERQLMEMALARFQWSGLPDSASSLHLEWCLLTAGSALVAVDPHNGSTLALQATPMGSPNYQNDYAGFRGTGSGYSQAFRAMRQHRQVAGVVTTEEPNAVVVWNNATRTPDVHMIQYYADRLAELDTTIDINSMNARRNKIVYADTDTELAAANILNEIAQGEPVIKVRSDITQVIGALDLSVHPDSIDRLHIFRGRMFNEAMMALGIDNTNQDKKERMVTDEIGGNDDQVARVRTAALNQRRKAARQMSAMLGRAVTVDYFTEDDPANDPDGVRTASEMGDGDVDVHDAAA